jgi:hypothetical protein
MRKRAMWVLVIVLCVGLACGAAVIVPAYRTAVRGERQIHAMLVVAGAVALYLEGRGRLPQSWEELVAFPSKPNHSGPFTWPDSEAELRETITVRFEKPLEEVSVHPLTEYLVVKDSVHDLEKQTKRLADTIQQDRRTKAMLGREPADEVPSLDTPASTESN